MNNNIIITFLYHIVIIIVILFILPFQKVLAEDLNNTNVRELIREEIRNFFLNITEQNVTNQQTVTFPELQEVLNDSSNDFEYSNPILAKTIQNLPDISKISYSNDGNFLNVTIDLNSSYLHNSTSNTTFGMWVSPMETPGYYYDNLIKWDIENNKWINSILKINSTWGEEEIYKQNISSALNNTNQIAMKLDLSRIGPPQNYQVLVYAESHFPEIGRAIDYVSPFLTPKQKFTIYVSPLKIEPAALKLIELRIQSNTHLGSIIKPYAIPIDIFDITISPTESYIGSYGSKVFQLGIKASDKAKVNSSYTIPFSIDMIFPSVFRSHPGQNVTHTQKSNLTAYIPQPEPPFRVSIPEQYLLPLYGIIPSFLIPTIYKIFNERRQRNNLQKLYKKLDHFSLSKNKDQIKDLDGFLKIIENKYVHDKISKDHYDMIKDKLLSYKKEFEQL